MSVNHIRLYCDNIFIETNSIENEETHDFYFILFIGTILFIREKNRIVKYLYSNCNYKFFY